MNYSIHQIPIFDRLKDSQNILLAGAGGGFDIYSGLPLYFALRKLGKNVILANYSFTWLDHTSARAVFPYCYQIRPADSDRSGRNYFPEKYLKLWLGTQGEHTPLYAFDRIGTQPLKAAYQYIIEQHQIDTVLLVDGGTDSLMFGDEEGLGTPQEDVCSMAAVHQLEGVDKYLLSIGFGIDHYHGVSHYRFLENLATIAKTGGYLGSFQLTQEMPAAQKFIEAVEFVNARMPGMESIVANSIASALKGDYGNVHSTRRTQGSELWINPLMTIYWCFELAPLIQQIQYYPLIKDVKTLGEFNGRLAGYRMGLKQFRKQKQLPI